MATTTNFGWTTPNDTDLVKDGAAAIRTLGSSIDTSFVDLKGGTTGQVLAKASNTDLDYSWIAVDPLTILDAKGDLITATAADTPARLAVGTNGQLLTADSTAATGLAWTTVSGGGMTLISTTSLASGSSVTINSIPGTYKALRLIIRNFFPSMNGTNLRMRFNGDANARYGQVQGFTNLGNATSTSMNIAGGSLTQIGNTSGQNQTLIAVNIPDYANTVTAKMHDSTFFGNSGTSGGWVGTLTIGGFNQTGAITSIDLLPDQGNFAGGSALLYGVN
jgi:hypothetical protein